MAWLRETGDLPEFESRVSELEPAVSIEDHTVTLRTVKHIGRLLDACGRARDVVPIDIWGSEAGSGHPVA